MPSKHGRSPGLIQESLRLQEQNLFVEAESLLEKALGDDGNNPVTLLFMGTLKWDLEERDSALSFFEKSLAADKSNMTARCFHQLAVYSRDRDEKEFSFLLKEHVNAASSFRGRLLLFCESAMQKKCVSFEEYLGRCLPPSSFFEPSPAPSPFRRRLILAGHAMRQASAWLRHPASPSKRASLLNYHSALRNRALGDLPGAIAILKGSADPGKSGLDSEELLAEMLLENGEVFEAREVFVRSPVFSAMQEQISGKTPPSNSYALLLAALLEFYTARYSEAETLLNLAARVDPTNYITSFLQGLLSLKEGGESLPDARRFLVETTEKPNENLIPRRLEKLKSGN
jgi:tetratricopeptide (TPR) repeat protein